MVCSLIFTINGVTLAQESIGIFDLRYTLNINPSDSEQTSTAWDHCHTVATLQGIVNRNAPNLYLLFVESQTVPDTNIDEYWLNKYRQPNQGLYGRKAVSSHMMPPCSLSAGSPKAINPSPDLSGLIKIAVFSGCLAHTPIRTRHDRRHIQLPSVKRPHSPCRDARLHFSRSRSSG